MIIGWLVSSMVYNICKVLFLVFCGMIFFFNLWLFLIMKVLVDCIVFIVILLNKWFMRVVFDIFWFLFS